MKHYMTGKDDDDLTIIDEFNINQNLPRYEDSKTKSFERKATLNVTTLTSR